MTWGLYIAAADGTPYITDESEPISLVNKQTTTGTGSATVSLTVDSNLVALPFVVTSKEAYVTYSISGSTLTITATQQVGKSESLTLWVYLFSTQAQIPPAWGMAIWDKNGKCILTNETRVLTDVQVIGTKGQATAGVNINVTKAGKWAMVPDWAGYFVGVVSTGGGPRPVQIYVGFTAVYDGTNTHFYSFYAELPPTNIISGNILNSMSALKVIDASRYD